MECVVRFLIVISLILNIAINAQIVNKVLISGIDGYQSHDEEVKNAFLQGYSSYNGTEYEGEILLYPYNIKLSFEYADTNNYQMIVRSTTGLNTGIYYADKHPQVKLVMPAGSNSSVQAFSGDIESCPVIVTGAGNTKNVTGFNIDFYSVDPITDNNYSSFSNGYIAGQIAFIANSLNCSIEEARIRARENGTEYGTWDTHNGYGKIDIEATISEVFPVELTSFTASQTNNGIFLNWTTATEVNNYGFEIEVSTSSVTGWENIGFVDGHGNSNSPKEYSFTDFSIAERSGVLSSSEYRRYRLKQIDTDGSFKYSDVVTVGTNNLSKTELYQNYPNPFNPTTKISFTLANESQVIVSVYNTLGQQVAELVNEEMNAGVHSVDFNAGNLTSGSYIYRIETANYSKTMKMLLLK